MFGSFLSDLLFLGIPGLIFLLWGICLWRFFSARIRNKKSPGTYTQDQLSRRKAFAVITSVLAIPLLVIIVGLIVLFSLAVAYM